MESLTKNRNFLRKIWIFTKNRNFLRKIWIFTKNLFFYYESKLCPKIEFFYWKWKFWLNIDFFSKNTNFYKKSNFDKKYKKKFLGTLEISKPIFLAKNWNFTTSNFRDIILPTTLKTLLRFMINWFLKRICGSV